MSECKCIKEISYYMYHDSRTCFRVLIWNLYLNLRWMDIKRKYFWWRKCLGTRTAWTASKQVWVLSWVHGKKCPFSSQMKSFIPTFRGTHLQFICVKKLFTIIVIMIFTSNALKTNGQSFKFTIKLRNLVVIEKHGDRNSHLSQMTYILGLKIICSNLI